MGNAGGWDGSVTVVVGDNEMEAMRNGQAVTVPVDAVLTEHVREALDAHGFTAITLEPTGLIIGKREEA